MSMSMDYATSSPAPTISQEPTASLAPSTSLAPTTSQEPSAAPVSPPTDAPVVTPTEAPVVAPTIPEPVSRPVVFSNEEPGADDKAAKSTSAGFGRCTGKFITGTIALAALYYL